MALSLRMRAAAMSERLHSQGVALPNRVSLGGTSRMTQPWPAQRSQLDATVGEDVGDFWVGLFGLSPFRPAESCIASIAAVAAAAAVFMLLIPVSDNLRFDLAGVSDVVPGNRIAGASQILIQAVLFYQPNVLIEYALDLRVAADLGVSLCPWTAPADWTVYTEGAGVAQWIWPAIGWLTTRAGWVCHWARRCPSIAARLLRRFWSC